MRSLGKNKKNKNVSGRARDSEHCKSNFLNKNAEVAVMDLIAL